MVNKDRVLTRPHSPFSTDILGGNGVATYTSYSKANLTGSEAQVLTHNGDPCATFLGSCEWVNLQSRIRSKKIRPDSYMLSRQSRIGR